MNSVPNERCLMEKYPCQVGKFENTPSSEAWGGSFFLVKALYCTEGLNGKEGVVFFSKACFSGATTDKQCLQALARGYDRDGHT